MRSLWAFWILAAIVGYAITRNLWVLGVAVVGPLIDIVARKATRERGPDASLNSFQLVFIASISAGLFVFGIIDGDATAIVFGAIGLPGALFFIWRRRRQAVLPPSKIEQ